jgi:hypothetical protein
MDFFDGYRPLDEAAKDGEPQRLANLARGDIGAGYWTGDMWALCRPDSTVEQLPFEPTHYKPTVA